MKELNVWITTLEYFNNELDYFIAIEKQLICDVSIANLIKGSRRKNILSMATFCKYEQELKNEYDYGKVEYDLVRAKIHEKKRELYVQLIQEYNSFKMHIYKSLTKYHRRV